MEFMRWNDSYYVGIEEIDDQHRKLVQMINTFYEQMQTDNKVAKKELLDAMAQYAVTHFKTEEKYFDLYKYPGADAHKKEHAAFVAQVRSVQQRLAEGKLVLTIEVTNFVKNWVVQHILGSDQKYGPYLTARGVK